MSIILRIILYGSKVNENFTAFLFLFCNSPKYALTTLESNGELSLSEKIKTPIPKKMERHDTLLSSGLLMCVSLCVCARMDAHVCAMWREVSPCRDLGLRLDSVLDCSLLCFLRQDLSLDLEPHRLYCLTRGLPHPCSPESCNYRWPPCPPCFHVGSGDPDCSPHACKAAASSTGPSAQVLVDDFLTFTKNLKHI